MRSVTRPIFKPRSRLLLQLGDQLIKNENIAVLELVKNSYDADAKVVIVKMQSVDNKDFGRIEILDDGIGMDDDIINNAWLEPGSDYKEKLYKTNKRSPKYKRLPIGEKGIGRFGVHKLADKIQLITRKAGKNEFVVEIDWVEFSKMKYLEEAQISVVERTPEYFTKSRTGTQIILTSLRTTWDRRMVRELYKSIFTLASPFKTIDHFLIKFEIDKKEWIKDLISWNQIKDYSLYNFKVKIEGSEITEFTYEFTPWVEMKKVSGKTINIHDQFLQDHKTIEVKSQEDKKQTEIINLEKYKIGAVEFEGYIFDRDLKILGLIQEQKITQIKRYLDENGGIRVYRDDLRINEYGEKGNDWLNLDLRRINVPTRRISNNIVLSVINLKRRDSSDLIEKTNREGFVENEAYNDFKAAIIYVINLIEKLRQVDKAELRERYSPSERDEPVLHLTNELKTYIEKSVKEEPVRLKILDYIEGIEHDYDEINKILLTSAGAGLTLGVGVHEIEKLVKELVLVARDESVTAKVSDLIKDIQTTVNNYLDLLKQHDKEVFSLKALLKNALSNVEFRLKVHDVKVIRQFENISDDIKVECSKRFFLSAVLNVIDNAIYWLENKYKPLSRVNQKFEKKVFIDVIKEVDGTLSVIIADNANGFTLPTSKIIKPFITAKDEGMGLGLHITSQILKVMDAELDFPDVNDFSLPSDFGNGALVRFKLKPYTK